MIDHFIFKPFRHIYRRADIRLEGLLCCRSAGMVFPAAVMFLQFHRKNVESYAAYRPVSGAQPITMMRSIQRLAWLGKNEFE